MHLEKVTNIRMHKKRREPITENSTSILDQPQHKDKASTVHGEKRLPQLQRMWTKTIQGANNLVVAIL